MCSSKLEEQNVQIILDLTIKKRIISFFNYKHFCNFLLSFEVIIHRSNWLILFASSVLYMSPLTSLTSVVFPPLSHRLFTLLSPHTAAPN